MVNISDDAKDGGYRRVEVLTEPGRRRKWSEAEKARIVAETLQPGTVVADVARSWQVSSQQVFTWRREMRRAALGPLSFVPTCIATGIDQHADAALHPFPTEQNTCGNRQANVPSLASFNATLGWSQTRLANEVLGSG